MKIRYYIKVDPNSTRENYSRSQLLPRFTVADLIVVVTTSTKLIVRLMVVS